MKCVSPVILKNQSARLLRTIEVPCGKCVPCLEQRRAQWSIRLREELKNSVSSLWLTLTYSEENLPFSEETGEPTLSKRDLQLFLKRLRKYLDKGRIIYDFENKPIKSSKNSQKIRYFACGEYGSKFDRPHYHIMLFNVDVKNEYLVNLAWSVKKEKLLTPIGRVDFGSVTDASIHYTAGYILQQYESDFEGRQKPFILHSIGIGKDYFTDEKISWHKNSLNTCYNTREGYKFPLPRYYQEKIFTDEKMAVSAKKNAYSKCSEQKSRTALEKDYPDVLDQIRVKQLRIQRYGEIRSKRLTKDKKL